MLVIFEGIDGVGKTTQISLLKEFKKEAILTKEPGGTKFGNFIRDFLLKSGDKISIKTEILLFLADRAEHIQKIIKPNLHNLILSDRSFISGIAYAMANDDSLDIEELLRLNNFATNGIFGDKFIFLKADENLIKKRLFNRGTNDEIEKRGIDYLIRVQYFMNIIFDDLKFNVLQIDASKNINEIQEEIRSFI